MKVAVVGTGYVGLVTAVVLAEGGHAVTAVDVDAEKARKIAQGDPTFYEPGLKDVLARVLALGNLRVTSVLDDGVQGAEYVFIAVGTPSAADGSVDLSYVQNAACEIASSVHWPCVIVMKSTVPVGTCEQVERTIREHSTTPEVLQLVSNPEFLREGTALSDARHPDRIIVGADDDVAAERMLELYKPAPCPVMVTSRRSAEIIKYASNAFLATKLSYINAMSRLCELCGADIGDVAAGIGLDHRVSPKYLKAGLGWGGSCLPKDVSGLIKTSEALGYDFELLKVVAQVNTDQTEHFVDRLRERLGGFKGARIALLGLAFKPGTDDVREAKSLQLIEHLLSEGAEVSAHDPVAAENVARLFPDVRFCDDPLGAVQDADAMVLVTEWKQFKSLDLESVGSCMRQRLLFDGRRAYSKSVAERAGFEYHTVGA